MNSDLRRFGDTCTVFMQYRAEAVADFADSSSIAVVGLHDSNELQLINLDGGLAQLLFDVVTQAWHKTVSMKVGVVVDFGVVVVFVVFDFVTEAWHKTDSMKVVVFGVVVVFVVFDFESSSQEARHKTASMKVVVIVVVFGLVVVFVVFDVVTEAWHKNVSMKVVVFCCCCCIFFSSPRPGTRTSR